MHLFILILYLPIGEILETCTHLHIHITSLIRMYTWTYPAEGIPSPLGDGSVTRDIQTHWQRHTDGGSPHTPPVPGTRSEPSRRRHWSAWFLAGDKYIPLTHSSLRSLDPSPPRVKVPYLLWRPFSLWRKSFSVSTYSGFQLFVWYTYNVEHTALTAAQTY